MNYERLYGIAVYKLILQRRGLIKSAICRAPTHALDADDMRELDIILASVESLFRV